MRDRKILHIISVVFLAVPLLSLVLPSVSGGRMLLGILLPLLAACTWFLVKKRSALSLEKRTVTLLLGVIGAVLVMLYYVSGIWFGFGKSGYGLHTTVGLRMFFSTLLVILSAELIRMIIRMQNSKVADVLSYLACLAAEVAISPSVTRHITFGNFMDLVGIALFPAVVANLLYHYLSKRYGMWPGVVYQCITSLYVFVIPYRSGMPDPLYAFITLVVPFLIYEFVHNVFEAKRRYAMGKSSRLSVAVSAITVAIMMGVIMLISNQFHFGAYVIATDSMTGELNRGDIAIYERHTDDMITVGRVIAFEKSGTVTVHRVVDINKIDGVTRYYTKGDMNEDPDNGYVTDAQIIGTVDFKVAYLGYPTLWLRSLFAH